MRTTTYSGSAAHWLAPIIRPALTRILSRLEEGTLAVTLPDGETRVFTGSVSDTPRVSWKINDYAMLWALLRRGPIALGESYWEGRWESEDMVALLSLLARNEPALRPKGPALSLRAIGDRLVHRSRRNDRRRAEKNIHAHYDLGNDFYGAWLDDTMTYSAALFTDATSEPLHEAQNRKYAELAAAAGVQRGDHVLEIGCGWGGFAAWAATNLDCRITAITISREQHDFAKARMEREGLSDKVEIRYCDYRDFAAQATASFDRVISIEMFEAVGEEYWHEYARCVMALLKPGGSAGLQVITVDESRFERYRSHPDFIQRYVFPGGMLPSPERLLALFRAAGAAEARTVREFGIDYAHTLGAWAHRFNNEWSRVRELGFDDSFRRFWNYYLAHCQAGFQLGWTNVGHFTIHKPA